MTLIASGVAPTAQQGGIPNFAWGTYTGDGNAGDIAVKIGFTPKYVKLMNLTDILFYEFFEGSSQALDTNYNDVYLMTGSTGVVTKDTTGAIKTNARIQTATENALNAPGSQSADLGTEGTTTVTFVRYDNTVERLTFTAGSSGALSNVSGKVYYWMAIG